MYSVGAIRARNTARSVAFARGAVAASAVNTGLVVVLDSVLAGELERAEERAVLTRKARSRVVGRVVRCV